LQVHKMTSSSSLTQRKRMGDTWRFGFPEDPLGGWESHYLNVNSGCHECVPGYVAIPIGEPYGSQICVKRKGDCGKTLDKVQVETDPSVWNGYNKYQADLYRPWRDTQIQLYNPYYYADRRTPHQSELITGDYLHLPSKYNANGINPIHTPGDTRFYEYGFSYAKNPPYKWNVQELEQRYPIWKQEKIYHGYPQEVMDEFDRRYQQKNMMGTW